LAAASASANAGLTVFSQSVLSIEEIEKMLDKREVINQSIFELTCELIRKIALLVSSLMVCQVYKRKGERGKYK